MGEYGMIHQDFWIDFEDVPVKEKLFLVYLFSNVRTNISGLYKIPLKVFTRDLRFSEKEVKEALRKAEELKFAYYDYDTSWVWVKGLAKRNMASEQQIKGIIKQVKKCESNILLKKFKEYYKEKGNFWQCFKEFLDTLSIPYHTLSPVSDSVSVSVTDHKDLIKKDLVRTDFGKIVSDCLFKCSKIKIPENKLNELLPLWEQTYKGQFDISREILKADSWLISNSRTKYNYARFLTNWFNRCLDKGFSSKNNLSSNVRIPAEAGKYDKYNGKGNV